MKSRKVVTRSGKGFRGYYPSKKLSRMVEFESLLERDAINLFENSFEVVTYQEQPALIHYYKDDLPTRYYPDFQLNLANEQIIHVEVKPSKSFYTPKLLAKYKSIALHYEQRNEHFVVLTEVEIRNTEKSDIYQILNNQNLVQGDGHA